MKQPSKMPGRPNSRGRLSLNLLTDPERSTKNKGKSIPREKQARGSPRLKKKERKKKETKLSRCGSRGCGFATLEVKVGWGGSWERA